VNPVMRWIVSARATRRLWQLALYALDLAAIALATLLAYYARFEGVVPSTFGAYVPWALGLAVVVYVLSLTAFGLYRVVLRYVGVDTALRLAAAVVVGFVALVAIDLVLPGSAQMRALPYGVLFIQALLVFLGTAAVRLAVRIALLMRSRTSGEARRVLIVGAGSAGSLLLREIQGRPDLGLLAVGFLDDEPSLVGRTIAGLPVYGPTSRLAEIVALHGVQEIVVAMPSAPRETVRAILNAAADVGVTTRITPALVMAKGAVRIADLRPVEVEDLLGREPTPIDVERVAETLAGKVVAVTGAAGSIGSEMCRQVIGMRPKRLVLIEIDETRLYELWLELEGLAPGLSVMRICDIRDAAKLDRVFEEERPSVVIHAAAYKHVPLMELSPDEAVITNVIGTKQVVEACERHSVERFVLISTDKAVEPANVMGLTKSLAERVMLSASARGKVLAVAVRFGNVLASRGSVIPIFETQLRHGGPLTVTDAEVTRFFMTIPEAARLVLQAQAIGRTGDIFVLEMGEPVRIVDLARKMIALSGVPAEIEFVGLRPGEKLHETLVHADETLESSGREKILRVRCATEPGPGFEDQVRALADAARAGDEAGIMSAIAALDPRFAERQRAIR
jgi:FlaA1/EpsC-like NDP-sugar epimerase